MCAGVNVAEMPEDARPIPKFPKPGSEQIEQIPAPADPNQSDPLILGPSTAIHV